MLFIHPMWDNESQRLGMLRCWKTAYLIHGFGELTGFLGLLVLLATAGYMAYAALFADFGRSHWLLLCIPFGLGVISEVMVQASWVMVGKRGFEYDYDSRIASWIENGTKVTYKHGQQGAAADAASRPHRALTSGGSQREPDRDG